MVAPAAAAGAAPARRRSCSSGVALLLVGFARPKASFHVKRRRRRVVLVLDVSGSMAAHDVAADAASRAREAARATVRAEACRTATACRVVTFSDHVAVSPPPTHDLDRGRAGDRSAPRPARRGRRSPTPSCGPCRSAASVQGHRGRASGRPRSSSCSPTAARPRGRDTPAAGRAAGARQARHPGLDGRCSARRTASCTQKLKGGYTEQIQVPAQPPTLQHDRARERRRFSTRRCERRRRSASTTSSARASASGRRRSR